MSPCSRCMVFRPLRLKSPPLKPFHRLPQYPRPLSSWSSFSRPPSAEHIIPGRPLTGNNQLRYFSSTIQKLELSPELVRSVLPVCCPGCGAYAQTVEPNEPGYYSKVRRPTRKVRAERQKAPIEKSETPTESVEAGTGAAEDAERIVQQNGEQVSPAQDADSEMAPPRPTDGVLLGDDEGNLEELASRYLESTKPSEQVCDRCHDLKHHNKAVPALSPSIYSIREYLNESPYKHNRVYHIIDAADFPMSLVPGIYDALSIQEQRSRNRRAKKDIYRGGKKLPTITFVITRSDLLAPTMELVDSKMVYMRNVLREALGKEEEDFRLGNVHMISAHRGWWTKKVKEEIREHGGGIWVVGKANVGKSSFIEACFPKDSKSLENLEELVRLRQKEEDSSALLDPDSLLPPAPRENLYPVLPVVSSLPGTTVSPIRIPFGRGKGEMIDLPGLDRGRLEDHVLDESKRDLIMTQRKKPERYTIKPFQSLLLGDGLVRITPVNFEDVVLAACFLPLEAHVTHTEKAIAMQTGSRSWPGKKKMLKEEARSAISSAGTFDLKWDVTNSHLPIAYEKFVERGGTPPPVPYKVMSMDLLIEGCGWVELTAQIRSNSPSDSPPQVEVFSPNGQHVASRRPFEGWKLLSKEKSKGKSGPSRKPRPKR